MAAKFRIPGLQVPADVQGETLAFFNALKERLELLSGERGDPEQRSISLRELREAGLINVSSNKRSLRPVAPAAPTENEGDQADSIDSAIDFSRYPQLRLAEAPDEMQLLVQGTTVADRYRIFLSDLLTLFARLDQESSVLFPWSFEAEECGFALTGAAPKFRFHELAEESDTESTRPADENVWEVEVDDSELGVYLVNDDLNTRTRVLRLARTGTAGDVLDVTCAALQHQGAQVLVAAGAGLSKADDTVSLQHLGLENLTNPGADRLPAWIDAAGALQWVQVGDHLELSGGRLSATGGSGGVADFRGASVRRTAAQSLADNTSTAISFDSEAFDVGDVWDVANPTRLTAPDDGKYLVGATVAFASNAIGKRQIVVRKNGSTILATSEIPAAAGAQNLCVAIVADLVATDYVELLALQDSGGGLDVNTATFYASLQNGALISHTHPASEIASGTFADARIAQSNVTQHEAALTIDWSQLNNVPNVGYPPQLAYAGI